MTRKSLQALASEFIGIAILAMTVVGSGIMAQYLTEDVGLQLLINAAATGAILWLIITLFAPIGGAQFNPVVTAIDLLTKKIAPLLAFGYIALQIAGAVVGTLLANLMFDLSALDTSETIRRSSNLYLSEVIATAGLILLIKILVDRDKAKKIPAAVALWIFAAYFFTASTSFANPAITIGRIFTDTFAGISPDSAIRFIPFQIIGGAFGYLIGEIFSEKKNTKAEVERK